MKVELDLPEIEGFEYTGEYRKLKPNEWFCNYKNEAENARGTPGPYPILKKKEPEYKTFFLTDENLKYVSINALEDAMKIIDNVDRPKEEFHIYNKLAGLLIK